MRLTEDERGALIAEAAKGRAWRGAVKIWEEHFEAEERRIVSELSGDRVFSDRYLDGLLAELRAIKRLRGVARANIDLGEIAERKLREDA